MDRSPIEINVTDATKELVVRAGNAPEIFQYKGFNYKTFTTQSFIDALRRFGSDDKTAISADGMTMKAILDYTVADRPQDTVTQQWSPSSEARRWVPMFEKKIEQALFVKFLERESRICGSATIENLLAQTKNLKISALITGDYSMDDRNNYTFMFKVGDTEGVAKIPSLIALHIPLIEGGRCELVDIEIDFIRPGNSNEKPGFVLRCPTWDDLLQKTIDEEINQIRQEFSGWLIIKGSV